MTRRLREDRRALAAVLAQVSASTPVPAAQLEKDFWLTEALRGVVEAARKMSLPVYLKGGTSLSKVFGIIERFSEDVDILVGLPRTDALMSAGRREAALRRLAAGAVAATGLSATTDPAATRRGEKRAVHLHDPPGRATQVPAWSLAPLRPEGLLVELSRWGGSQPHTRTTIRSLIADHADRLGLPPFDEQRPVHIDVVEPARTAVEKLALLHSAAHQEDEGRRRIVARHYYDVWRLLKHAPTATQLARPGLVAAIANEVLLQTMAVTPPVHRPAVMERPLEGFSASDAFAASSSALAATRDAYERTVLRGLLWPSATARPTFDECCATVRHFPGGL